MQIYVNYKYIIGIYRDIGAADDWIPTFEYFWWVVTLHDARLCAGRKSGTIRRCCSHLCKGRTLLAACTTPSQSFGNCWDSQKVTIGGQNQQSDRDKMRWNTNLDKMRSLKQTPSACPSNPSKPWCSPCSWVITLKPFRLGPIFLNITNNH